MLGLSIALVGSEIALRCYVAVRGWTPNCYATGLVFFVPHEQAGYTLRPNLRLGSSTYNVQINSRGFRGPEISTAEDDFSQRIVVLGGSSVFGYLVGEGNDSCRLLEGQFNQFLSKNPNSDFGSVDVWNAGVPGYNLTQSRLRFETDIAPLQPDVVLLYLGWNDIPMLLSDDPSGLDRTPPAPSWTERALSHSVLYGFLRFRVFPPDAPQFAPPASSSNQVTERGGEAFREELEKTIDAIFAAGARPVLATQIMASGSANAELDDYLGSSPEQVAANRRIGRWLTTCIREVASERNVPLIDSAAEIEANSATLGDAIHLSEQGHKLVAESWLNGLTKYDSAQH